jgi:hypothetical protein
VQCDAERRDRDAPAWAEQALDGGVDRDYRDVILPLHASGHRHFIDSWCHDRITAAERLTAMRTAEAFFAERKGRGEKDAAIRFLTRAGGEPPRPGNELPDPGDGDGQRQAGR